MSDKNYLVELLEMSDDALNAELENIKLPEFRNNIRLAYKQIHRDTRHACAEAVINTDPSPHNACMNCSEGLPDIIK